MLIDAGEPGTGLREYAQRLAGDRKLLLSLTHGHYDHSGVINDFDEVYHMIAVTRRIEGGENSSLISAPIPLWLRMQSVILQTVSAK